MNNDRNIRIRKTAFGITLSATVFLLCFGGGKPPAALARDSRSAMPIQVPPERMMAAPDGPGGAPLINDAFYPPNRPAPSPESGPMGSDAPGWYDTSVFMTGTIAIGVILPESTGPASTEDWNLTRQNRVADELAAGLLRWVEWGSDYGVDLNWEMEFNFGVPTTYEPITMKSWGSPGQCTWIPGVMTALGFPGTSCFNQVQAYINDLRDRHHTDWAFAIFVVDSLNDADGTFTDGYFGYAYFGGPFVMLTYDNDGWGIGSMDAVIQHEMGHIFYAADTYSAPGYGGCMNNTDPYGYLGIPNSNCEVISADPLEWNLGADTDVLMTNSNTDRVHWTTLHQVGWRDSDSDGIPDVEDTQPAFYALEPFSPDPTSAGRLEYTGTAYDNPWPHVPGGGLYSDLTINTIAAVEYRVDGGSWLPAVPADGSFDSDYEPFWFDTGALPAGPRLVEVQAINSVGNASDIWSDTVEIVEPAGPFGKVAPVGGSFASTSPTLAWETSSGATAYEFCADTIDNDHCDTAWVSALSPTSAAISGLGNNDRYYWQVRSWSSLGWTYADGGAWSSFTARDQTFSDVPIDHSLWQYIEAFYSAGITSGCGFDPLIFCPSNNVTRAAMAVFLLRAKYGAGYAPPPATHTFADLPVAGKEWQEAWVDQFYSEGITTGCGTDPLIYCPENPVTRAAMAVFILRTLEGPSYTPPAASHFFADLPVAGKEWMEPWVDEVYRRGITTGCGTGPLIFCPETAVKRQAMAAFIVRAFNLPMP